ncbi:alpha/beta hydrolase [Roseovarius ramblicola]|uniref:Alpha/beta hydrolase n=1 Tax=Roseovarius ramblicola TaxID=2022336 RepID=A0ABV5I2Z3_9RHOB
MRRWLLRAVLALALLLGVGLILAPREPVEMPPTFDTGTLDGGIDAFLAAREARYDDIRPDSHKRVIWAGAPETRTPLAIVYLHGFSASSQEIRPVPDMVAQAFGANLVFTRFRGHGRDGDAMAEATASDWLADAAESLAVGRAAGDRVVILATSTGATVATLALADPALRDRVAGAILVSPNFGINNPLAPLLTWPGARHWLPLVAGKRRSFEPRNPGQAAEWTTEYPSTAVFPMAALVARARSLDPATIPVPALFYYSEADTVVRPDLTDGVLARWGGPATRVAPVLAEGDDPSAHVVAGDIMSPGNTAAAAQAMTGWIERVIAP